MTTIFVYISLKIHNLRYYNEQNTCQGREFRCVCRPVSLRTNHPGQKLVYSLVYSVM